MRNLLVGSNQFVSKYKEKRRFLGLKYAQWRDILWLTVILGYLAYASMLWDDHNKPIVSPMGLYQVEVAEASDHFQGDTNIVTPTPLPTKLEEQAKIEAYMKTIFGADFRVARAISHNECNPANPKYPACVLHSNVEYSVGLFQINLYNSKQWIHAGRIPGETMGEKAEWLKDPFNNTLYAYWVFKKSGWNPWSAYTNGNYLRSM